MPSDEFDLPISYISLVDVPDMHSAVLEAFRVIRPCGRFVVCNLHPIISASPGWIRQGNLKLHYPVDWYFYEGELNISPREDRLWTNLHRTFSTHICTFLDAGFMLEDIREPTPPEKQAGQYLGVNDNLRVTEFIIYVLRKP